MVVTKATNENFKRVAGRFPGFKSLIGASMLLVVASVGLLVFNRPSRGLVTEDRSFRFHFCTVTRGTNHILMSGNKLLAQINSQIGKLNSKLNQWAVRPISNDQIIQLSGTADETLVSVGFWTDPAATDWVLAATLVSPKGELNSLERLRGDYFTGADGRFYEWVYIWRVPAQITNVALHQLVFSKVKDGKKVATLSLE